MRISVRISLVTSACALILLLVFNFKSEAKTQGKTLSPHQIREISTVSKKKARTKKRRKKRIVSGIIGKDDRVKPTGNLVSLKDSIGLLLGIERQSSCTAFCLSPDTIASAAHCIFQLKKRKKNKHSNLAGTLFFLKEQSRYSVAGILGRDDKALRMGIIAGNKKRALPVHNFPKDWMVMKLKSPICSKGLLLADKSIGELAKAARNKRLFMAGFHGDKQDKGLLVSNNCRVKSLRKSKSRNSRTRKHFRKSGAILLHTCDTFPGSSGSPILLQENGKLHVVAINVGTRTLYRHTMRGRKIIKTRIRSKTNVGVLTKVFHAKAEWMKTHTPLTKKNDLVSLQIMLNDAGFKAGKADGVIGPKTTRAIKAYESAHKMSVTGIPSITLSEIIIGEYGKRFALKKHLPADDKTIKACRFVIAQRAVETDKLESAWEICLNSKKSFQTAKLSNDSYVSCIIPGDTEPVTIRSMMCGKLKGRVIHVKTASTPYQHLNIKKERRIYSYGRPLKVPKRKRFGRREQYRWVDSHPARVKFSIKGEYVKCHLMGEEKPVTIRRSMCGPQDGNIIQ